MTSGRLEDFLLFLTVFSERSMGKQINQGPKVIRRSETALTHLPMDATDTWFTYLYVLGLLT